MNESCPMSTTHSAAPVHHVSPTQKAFNVWGIIVAIWAVYRATIGAQSPITFDEFIFKPLLFLWPVLYYVTQHEKKNLANGLWLKFSHLKREIIFSLLIIAPIAVFAGYVVMSGGAVIDWSRIGLIVSLSAMIAITEETLSRGFVARHIYEETGGLFKTVFQASILHMFLRIPRIMTMPELFGNKLMLFFGADMLMSFVLTIIFLYRKNIIPVYIVRFATNVTLLLLLT